MTMARALPRLNIYLVQIPFLFSFRHHTFSRKSSQSLFVEISDGKGLSGFGEALPRPYVTGENLETSAQFIQEKIWPRVQSFLLSTSFPETLDKKTMLSLLSFLDDLSYQESRRDHQTTFHAARCAVEMALWDYLLKKYGKRLEDLFPPLPGRTHIPYSGVVPLCPDLIFKTLLRFYKFKKVSHIKIKTNAIDDARWLKMARSILGPSPTLHLDGNFAYSREKLESFRDLFRKYGVGMLEQPLSREELLELKSPSFPFSLMADESLITAEDAEQLCAHKTVNSFNLRLSKVGGIIPLLRLHQTAKKYGLQTQLGAQVGGSSLTGRVERVLSFHLELDGFEASPVKGFLRGDITADSLPFSFFSPFPPSRGPGLGVAVDRTLLKKFSIREIEG